MERVESVEELFLHALFIGQELNIVDQQDVNIAELVPERDHPVITQRINQFIREFFTGNVADGSLGLAALDFMANGLHQVGLPHSHTTIEKQRIVSLGRPFSHRLRGGMGKLIAGANDKCLKSVFRIELRSRVPVEALLFSAYI